MRAESLGHHVLSMTPRPLCSEKSHLCGEMGWWGHAGLPPCCSKTAECVSMWSLDKTTQDLRTGGFWLATTSLLWCHAAHNGMSMGMVIVLCLPQWNNMQLSIAKRGRNYAVPEWKQSWDCSGIWAMPQLSTYIRHNHNKLIPIIQY